MNAWINQMAETMGIGLDFSISQMSALVPDMRILWIVAAAAAFCLVAGCQETWSNQGQDRESDTRQE
jgi:hypothetical protein